MTMYTFQQQQQRIIQEQEQQASCVEFSAMGFGYHSHSSNFSDYDSCKSEMSVTSNISGWGSAVSRKSYACLKTLGETETRKSQLSHSRTNVSRQARARVVEGVEVETESWGYFVDTVER